MTLISDDTSSSLPATPTSLGFSGNVLTADSSLKKHESLLHKIATSFGLSDNESSNVIKQVYSDADRYNGYKNNGLSVRILLSKIMVHKCIFRISSEYFNSNGSSAGNVKGISLPYYRNYKSRGLQCMPLSVRTVFVLSTIGFNETEIAEILNTTIIDIKERFNKASVFINSR